MLNIIPQVLKSSGYTIQAWEKPRDWVVLFFLLLLTPLFSPLVTADSPPGQPQINAHWVADEFGETMHAYRVLFADGESYQALVDIEHDRGGEILATEIFQSWDLIDGLRVLDVQLNTSLEWGDIVSVAITITHYAGQELVDSIEVERNFEIGTWNQPMDDHEIMLETTWDLDQTFNNSYGPQGFELDFIGQGWQQRIGNTVESWELGNGSVLFIESTDVGSNNLSLTCSRFGRMRQ